jgi:D-sorbitol dehydrogenase (acceptor)
VSRTLDGRRALVTGAAGGIGAATARRFCEEGAHVVLSDRDENGVSVIAEALSAAGYEAHARPVEVTDEASVKRLTSDAAVLLGGIDLVVANAGVLSVGTLSDLSPTELERTLAVNVIGTFLTLKQSLPHVRAAGGGTLLCTASQAGVHGYPGMSAYCASKFAVVGLVESLAQELAPDGIRVCAVAPGITDTAMYDELVSGRARRWGLERAAAERRLARSVPLGRSANPEEIADAFVYLASPAAAYISGIALVIDGGELSG